MGNCEANTYTPMHAQRGPPTPSSPAPTTDTPKQMTPNQVATQMGYAVGSFGWLPIWGIYFWCVLEYARARAVASGAEEVVIATDDERIASVARGFGASVALTDSALPSGSDRIAAAARARGSLSIGSQAYN